MYITQVYTVERFNDSTYDQWMQENEENTNDDQKNYRGPETSPLFMRSEVEHIKHLR
jgi:hypothetical protein